MHLRQLAAAGIVITLCALGLKSSPSQPSTTRSLQQDISVNGDDQTTTIDCKGGAVNISGDDNTITLKNECSRLTIAGDDNTVKAETVAQVQVLGDDNTIVVQAVGRINTTGDDNTVTWTRGTGGKPPEISNTGDGNKTTQAR